MARERHKYNINVGEMRSMCSAVNILLYSEEREESSIEDEKAQPTNSEHGITRMYDRGKYP